MSWNSFGIGWSESLIISRAAVLSPQSCSLSNILFNEHWYWHITSTVLVEDSSRERQGLAHLACNQKGSSMGRFLLAASSPFLMKNYSSSTDRNLWPAELLKTPVQTCPPPHWVGRLQEGQGEGATTSAIGTRNQTKAWGFLILEIFFVCLFVFNKLIKDLEVPNKLQLR